MKIDTYFSGNCTFEYWKPIFGVSGETGGTTIRYEFADRKKGLLVPKSGGSNVLITKDQMELDGEIRGLKDYYGQEVFVVNGAPYAMFVHTVEPVFDIFGKLVQWRHNIKRAYVSSGG